jgi:hypothetical protein
MTPPAGLLADAARRLNGNLTGPRGKPGRPRKALASGSPSESGHLSTGTEVQGHPTNPTPNPGTLSPPCSPGPSPRGLPVKAAATYCGISSRELWRLVRLGLVPVTRWPGCRRAIFDLEDLRQLFTLAYKETR